MKSCQDCLCYETCSIRLKCPAKCEHFKDKDSYIKIPNEFIAEISKYAKREIARERSRLHAVCKNAPNDKVAKRKLQYLGYLYVQTLKLYHSLKGGNK